VLQCAEGTRRGVTARKVGQSVKKIQNCSPMPGQAAVSFIKRRWAINCEIQGAVWGRKVNRGENRFFFAGVTTAGASAAWGKKKPANLERVFTRGGIVCEHIDRFR